MSYFRISSFESYIPLQSSQNYRSITLLHIPQTLRLLPPPLPPLITPREMQHRHQKETVSSIRNTSQHIPPSDKRSDYSKSASCEIQSVVRCGDAVDGGGEHVGGGQHQEGEPYGEEEGGEGYGGF